MKSDPRLIRIILILGLCLEAGSAPAAVSLLQDNEFSSDFASVNAELDYSKSALKEPGFFFSQGNIAFGGSQSKSEDTTTGVTTNYKTQNFSGGIGWAYATSWTFDVSVFSSKTPETKYTQSGNSLDIAYSHKFLSEDEMAFSPRISVGFGVGNSSVEQTLSFKILNVFIQRNINLDQRKSTAYISLMPVEWFKLKLSGTSYSYSKSKTDLQTAYSSRFLNYYTGDLVSTIGGLPEYSSSVKFTFYIGETWDVELLAANTHLIVDDSTSKKTHIILSKTWDPLIVGFGFSRNETTQSKDTAFLLNFSYDF